MVTANNCFWRLEMSLFLIGNCWRVRCYCERCCMDSLIWACLCVLLVRSNPRTHRNTHKWVAVLLFSSLFVSSPPASHFSSIPSRRKCKRAKNCGGQWDFKLSCSANKWNRNKLVRLFTFLFIFSTAPLSQPIHPLFHAPSASISSWMMIDDVYFGSNNTNTHQF